MGVEEEKVARAYTKELLGVIESIYELRIENTEAVSELITGATVDAAMILRICTALNSWVAMNVNTQALPPSPGGAGIELPLDVVKEVVKTMVAER